MAITKSLNGHVVAVAVAVAAGLLAASAAQSAWVNIAHNRLPDSALALDSDDPVALVRSAQMKLATGQSFGGGADEIADIARRSVGGLPINAPALRLLGASNLAAADVELVREQMNLSDRMARRDIGSQLWLIEDAVFRNDIDGALRHYDTALRISKSTRALLYPVLADAIQDPLIRQRFVPYVQDRPPWLQSFFRHKLEGSDDSRAMVDLLRRAGGMPQSDDFAPFNTQLLRRLVEQGHYVAATDYFRSLSNADPALLTSLQLTDQSVSENHAPISWQPFSVPGIDPFVVASQRGTVEIESDIERGFSGAFARKLLALPAGRHALRISFKAENSGLNDFIGLSLTCPGNAADTVSLLAAERQIEEGFTFQETFVVPKSCPVQMIVLSARTTTASQDNTISLTDARLR